MEILTMVLQIWPQWKIPKQFCCYGFLGLVLFLKGTLSLEKPVSE